jgi:hypothetical protein
MHSGLVNILHRVTGIVSRSNSSRAAMSSALSYPCQSLSPLALRRTISESLAVACSFKRCTAIGSGMGRESDVFDCLEACGKWSRSWFVV